MPTTDRYEASAKFVEWLQHRLIERASTSPGPITGKPDDRFWLGRLAPTHIARRVAADPRLERLEPCQIGFRFLPIGGGRWEARIDVSLSVWGRPQPGVWQSLGEVTLSLDIVVADSLGTQRFGAAEFQRELSRVSGRADLSAEINVEVADYKAGGRELLVTLVNTSTLDDGQLVDPRFYEAALSCAGVGRRPYLLEGLEDTFRFDRRIEAYGINGGVSVVDDELRTTDFQFGQKMRPAFWGGRDGREPNTSFEKLREDPIPPARALLEELEVWGEGAWAAAVRERRALEEGWSNEAVTAANDGAGDFAAEVERVRDGIRLLESNPELRRAFQLMNEAFSITGRRRNYSSWRPFQLGFLLSNLRSLLYDDRDRSVVDIVWFATGGGKTETYLGLIATAAFFDRLTGKLAGCTAWSRFPLRLLSLQQMQRFADTLAASELIRRNHQLGGEPFSLGFLVGNPATPNKVRRVEQDSSSKHDPDDPGFADRYRLLTRCPFCGSTDLRMAFNFSTWVLEHRCASRSCLWGDQALPFYVVDEEIFRFLPTVVVGTLDKAALVGMQQAMRGLLGPPRGTCPRPGHGFTYNPSSKAPTGCLVPDCSEHPRGLPFEGVRFAPTFRLQDELHLLRDSLGAIDAHYEAVLDGIQRDLTGIQPKIVASSATLSGYRKQSRVLYRRDARVFPQPAPSSRGGFWTRPTNSKMRAFVALAPRGATVEFAVDRLLNELQIAVREFVTAPQALCAQLDVDEGLAEFLVDQYGTNVVYGNTIRDLEAVARSSGTQLVDVPGDVNIVPLTGKTQFGEVSDTLERLEFTDSGRPFEERIHVVTASSMMSHGVDIDRLNVMIVLGVPLTTAEFIQATARVGRRWPALVIVLHKIARERDAGVYRSFPTFVEQGDRLVEPIPITKRSRRVLERTLSGLEMARLLHLHAPEAADRFTTVDAVRRALRAGSLVPEDEVEGLTRYLEFDDRSEEDHINDVSDNLERYWDRVNSPQTKRFEWFGNVWAHRPMTSLRDVDEQVPVHLRR